RGKPPFQGGDRFLQLSRPRFQLVPARRAIALQRGLPPVLRPPVSLSLGLDQRAQVLPLLVQFVALTSLVVARLAQACGFTFDPASGFGAAANKSQKCRRNLPRPPLSRTIGCAPDFLGDPPALFLKRGGLRLQLAPAAGQVFEPLPRRFVLAQTLAVPGA